MAILTNNWLTLCTIISLRLLVIMSLTSGNVINTFLCRQLKHNFLPVFEGKSRAKNCFPQLKANKYSLLLFSPAFILLGYRI